VQNKGKVLHELVIGTKAELDAHAALMVRFPDMAHDEPYMAHVGPQKTGQLIWTFNRAGEFDFACLINGHYQSGMVGKIRVAAAQALQATDATPAPTPEMTEATEAEVRKVDVSAGKVTLRHGEIKNLDMPPMTMVFQVKDRAFLTKLKAGDRVNFTADKIKGAYTVLSIQVIQ
jgi:Cu/Ag efflux protein CusF